MAKNARPTSNKRAREKAQQERQKEKQQRRFEAKDRKGPPTAGSGGEDPDIAGIRPGPQPKPDWLLELDAENEAEADDNDARQ
jgi:hypothetical protein